jgi:hypothetical protein
MEQLRGGMSGREKALALVQQGLAEMGPGTRVMWMDSATGSITPLPGGVNVDRLPMVTPSSTTTDVTVMLRTALQEIARAGVGKAEIWIPTDRQTSAWIPDGVNTPEWADWSEMDTDVTLRLLDVARTDADAGNRTLQMTGIPVRDGDELKIPMKLMRDKEGPESLPLIIEYGGLNLRDNIMVEGTSFLWEQVLPIEPGQKQVTATFSVPADSNTADNTVVIAWRDRGAIKARVDVSDLYISRVATAGLLPREGLREVVDQWADVDETLSLWVRDQDQPFTDEEKAWIEAGGVVFQLPKAEDLSPVDAEDGSIGVSEWNEQAGILATEQREPLRMDLLRITHTVPLSESGENVSVMARLADGQPLLVRREMGEGAVYECATLPDAKFSNLAAGFVWVPVMQRMLQEGRKGEKQWGIKVLGDWTPDEDSLWTALDGSEADPRLQVGLYEFENQVVALNRPLAEDLRGTLPVAEVQEWAEPLNLIAFEAEASDTDAGSSRFEFTSFLALLGLIFLVVESWLLTRNIRKTGTGVSATPSSSAWRSAA